MATAAALGHENAKIAIVEFSDYECPFCSTFEREVFPDIKKALVDTGKARYFIANFPLSHSHPRARDAAAAAECLRGTTGFWSMRTALFANQRSLGPADLARFAASFGADAEGLRSCLQRREVLETIDRQVAEGKRHGVSATPTFLVATIEADGSFTLTKRIVGTRPAAIFLEEIGDSGQTFQHSH